MKKLLIIIFSLTIPLSVFCQNAGKIGSIETGTIKSIGSVGVSSINKIGNIEGQVIYETCKELLLNNPGSPDGIYTIDPDGSGPDEPINCYCDMTTDGGGWTLVLLNNKDVTGCPSPFWTEVVNDVNLNGILNSDITSFDLFLGVKYWNNIGTEARLEMGASPSSLSHRAYYDLSLDENNNYALQMANESITINTEGTASPGMYSYHNGRLLTTRDNDNDTYASNCSNNYGHSAWWYANCWNGSFWGGGGVIYQDAPYWSGDATEYFEYGSIWLR